jgi:EmrB/QacA subfamily drug resistance transporter
MPTIVGQLGGLGTFSWVFSGFMLSFTASIAVFGKLSDLFGRRRVYLAAMIVFLGGSLLCGAARSMNELIVYRIVQGVGAGGLLPLIFAMIGDVYSFEQRARVQGLFASMWGLASILGPVVGGLLVDGLSWRWVFLLNVPLGIVAAAVLLLVWTESGERREVRIDYAGAALLVGAVVSLLLALAAAERHDALVSTTTWALAAASVVLCAALWRIERIAEDPIVPIRLFRERLFVAACGHAFASGFAVFGSLTFIPLFVQLGSGVGATRAGASLLPLMLPWVVSSNVSSRLILKFRYRTVALVGAAAIVVGIGGMMIAGAGTSTAVFVANCSLTGIGMGLSSPVFLIAVQTALPRAVLGTATSTLQLCRSIGTAIGVTIMGAILAYIVGPGLDAVRTSSEPGRSSATAVELSDALRRDLAKAERAVFAIAWLAAVGTAAFTIAAPSAHLRNFRLEPDVQP